MKSLEKRMEEAERHEMHIHQHQHKDLKSGATESWCCCGWKAVSESREVSRDKFYRHINEPKYRKAGISS